MRVSRRLCVALLLVCASPLARADPLPAVLDNVAAAGAAVSSPLVLLSGKQMVESNACVLANGETVYMETIST